MARSSIGIPDKLRVSSPGKVLLVALRTSDSRYTSDTYMDIGFIFVAFAHIVQ